jgi:RNA polymerase sigma-70 factor (ECF subfamily)
VGAPDPDAGRGRRGPTGHGLRGPRLERARQRRRGLVAAPIQDDVDVGRLFRRESGRAVASLIAALGDFDLAEEAVQDAFAVALERWPREGAPANPGAWITTVARNRAVDRLRREANLARKTEALQALAELEPRHRQGADAELAERDIYPDERLRLMFTCCHPALAPGSRVALTLRTLGGLSTAEIARAFLASEEAMSQRLVRAKRKIRDAGIRYEVPERERMPERLPSVLATIYLIFNEGYLGTSSDELIRAELCEEAIRLAALLATMLRGEPEAVGLLALMELTHARRDARVGSAGELVTLAEQDRSRWDRAQIERGLALAERATVRGPAGQYTVQAAIAAEHARAESAAETDWARIANLYLWLERFDPSPVVALNRAVAVAEAEGPERGLELVDAIAGLDGYQPRYVARADLLARLERPAEAAAAYRKALALTENPVQRAFIERRLGELVAGAG